MSTMLLEVIIRGDIDGYTGHYYPAHISKHNRQIAARWKGIGIITDSFTNRIVLVPITAWGPKADYMAQNVQKGDAITCELQMGNFPKRIFLNGEVIKHLDGTPVSVNCFDFTVVQIENPKQSTFPPYTGGKKFGYAKVFTPATTIPYQETKPKSPVVIRYRLSGYNSTWIVTVESVCVFIKNLTNNPSVFTSTKDCKPDFELLEVI